MTYSPWNLWHYSIKLCSTINWYWTPGSVGCYSSNFVAHKVEVYNQHILFTKQQRKEDGSVQWRKQLPDIKGHQEDRNAILGTRSREFTVVAELPFTVPQLCPPSPLQSPTMTLVPSKDTASTTESPWQMFCWSYFASGI